RNGIDLNITYMLDGAQRCLLSLTEGIGLEQTLLIKCYAPEFIFD
ncbi:MAG: hypothetical protein ACI9KN_002216, partial [Gammaproteobacteria bacterium]